MTPYSGTDYFDVQGLLSEEEVAIRDTVHEFVQKEFLPVIHAHHHSETFPTELIGRLGRLGILGANLPAEYGCAGINNVSYGLIMQELERGDSGLRSFASVQGALVMYAIYRYGSEAQKRHWLPRLASGEAVGCFGLTEPDYGSDPGGLTTRSREKGDGYVLDGVKMWITNGTLADVAVIWARDDDAIIRGFLVEKNSPGFTANKITGKYSLRASDTAELVLEDCRIPRENRLEGAEGLKGPLSCLTQARYGIAWGTIGAAMACYEIALSYGRERVQFGRPVASFQLTQKKLVDMISEITKGQLLVLQLGRLKDEGRARHEQVSLAKMNNAAAAREVARMAREILAANGIMEEYNVMRHLMNMETVVTYEGTHEIHILAVGADITGMEAFR